MNTPNYQKEYSFEFRDSIDNSQIGKILRGSIDMHIHFSPDPNMTRRYSALGTAINAREAGLRGIVLKSHTYQTAPLASLVSELVPDIYVFGGICLDYECGGLNARAVEAAGKLGAKVVWMPTFSSRNSCRIVSRKLGINVGGDGISIITANGKVVPDIIEILKIIKDYDMVLATGHISPQEIFALVDKAKQTGVTKIVVTHALSRDVVESTLKAEERQMLAKEGVLLEYTAIQISPVGERRNPEEVATAINSDGPINCIMSSDFGQIVHPSAAEGLRLFISAMLKCHLSEEDITYMVKLNPARLLGLSIKE